MKLIIEKKVICFLLLTIPFLGIPFFDQYAILDILFNIGKIISSVFVISYYIIFKKRVSKICIIIICMEAYLVFTTWVNDADMKRCILTALPIIMVCLLYEIGFDCPYEFIKSQYILFSIIIFLNFISEIIFPKGMYISETTNYWNNWILGYYNNHSVYYIMAICMALLYFTLTKKAIGVFILFIEIMVSALLVHSGGVIGTLLAMFLMGLCLSRSVKMKNCIFYFFWCIHLVFFIVVITLNTEIAFILYDISEILFNKGNSFFARYNLWKLELRYLNRNWITGFGVENQMARLNEYGWALHTHNFILEILHQGGIVYLGFLCTIIRKTGKHMKLIQTPQIYNILILCFFGWIVNTLVEPFITPFLVSLFVVAERANKLSSVSFSKNYS